LVEFTPADVQRIEHWFDDPETQARLGDRDWIRRAPSLLDLTIRDEFRGKRVMGRHLWLSVDDEHVPVGFVDAEIYDRYAHWDGADVSGQAVSDVVETASMGFAVVINPPRRSRGFGTATIRAAIEHPDVKNR
jgi:GNAT superfamily N-acetyltransferase